MCQNVYKPEIRANLIAKMTIQSTELPYGPMQKVNDVGSEEKWSYSHDISKT